MRLFSSRALSSPSLSGPPQGRRIAARGFRAHRNLSGSAGASATRAGTPLGLDRFAGRTVLRGAIPRRGVVEFPFRLAFVGGLALMGAGAAFFWDGSWMLALVAVFVFGFGIGFLTAGTNLWIGEAYRSGGSGALSLVNFSWAVGAVACPFIVQFMQSPARLHDLLMGLAAAAALLGAVFAASPADVVELRRAGSLSTTPTSI